jgi:hypothetical protein
MKLIPTNLAQSQQPSGEEPQAAFQSIDQQFAELRDCLAKMYGQLTQMCEGLAKVNEQHDQTCKSLEVLSRLVLAVEKMNASVDGLSAERAEKQPPAEQSDKPHQQQRRKQ